MSAITPLKSECLLTRYTYDKNVEMIQPLMSNIGNIFGFGPLVAKRRIRSDRSLFCEFT
jgi:hypothetical protein